MTSARKAQQPDKALSFVKMEAGNGLIPVRYSSPPLPSTFDYLLSISAHAHRRSIRMLFRVRCARAPLYHYEQRDGKSGPHGQRGHNLNDSGCFTLLQALSSGKREWNSSMDDAVLRSMER